jgi:RimJ/RimL family protein N-acetyltransferase
VALSARQYDSYIQMMITPTPIVLEGESVRLEPLSVEHHDGLVAAASDGRLWELWYTGVAPPDQMQEFIQTALKGQERGHMLPWAVREPATGAIVGTTRFHDIVTIIDRVEIGYTFYAQRWQRSHVNTTCKLLLLEYAFESLGCRAVGLRTDRFNLTSQRAIERLGAHKDGVLRHFQPRRDGTARDSVIYSILAHEWPDVRRNLELRLARHEVVRTSS